MSWRIFEKSAEKLRPKPITYCPSMWPAGAVTPSVTESITTASTNEATLTITAVYPYAMSDDEIKRLNEVSKPVGMWDGIVRTTEDAGEAMVVEFTPEGTFVRSGTRRLKAVKMNNAGAWIDKPKRKAKKKRKGK